MINLLSNNNITGFLKLVSRFEWQFSGDHTTLYYNEEEGTFDSEGQRYLGPGIYIFKINNINWEQFESSVLREFNKFKDELKYQCELYNGVSTLQSSLDEIYTLLERYFHRVNKIAIPKMTATEFVYGIDGKRLNPGRQNNLVRKYSMPPHELFLMESYEDQIYILNESLTFVSSLFVVRGASPILDSLIRNEEYLEYLKDLHDVLLNSRIPYIENITRTNFIKIFTCQLVDEKINWVGKINELNYLITKLYRLKILRTSKGESIPWKHISKCFLLDGKTINSKSLSNNVLKSKGNRVEKHSVLYPILLDLEKCCSRSC